jgi:hypothetical protein
MLAVMIFFTSVFCRSESSIQSEKRKKDISIETQAIDSTKTKVEFPTLVSTQTPKPFLTATFTPTNNGGKSATIEATPTKWIDNSSTPQSTPLCYCNRNYECNHFETQRDAQICFNFCNGSKTNNWSYLDPDHNGIACEDLP